MTSTPPTPEELPITTDPSTPASVSPAVDEVQPPQRGMTSTTKPRPVVPEKDRLPVTKLGRIWTATVLGLIVLVLLIIFIAQNQDQVTLRYFAYEGQVNLGLALFIAAVGGALLTAAAAVARIIQLRATAKRKRKAQAKG